MKQLTALGIVVGSLTVVSFQPAMLGLIIGISAVVAITTGLARNARKMK